MYEAGENDEISIIAIGFNTNGPNSMNNLNVTYIDAIRSMQMMKFQQLPLLLLLMSQNMGRIVEIYVFDHT